VELKNPKPIYRQDGYGWHWSLTWHRPDGTIEHRAESDKPHPTQAAAIEDFERRDAAAAKPNSEGK